MGLDQLPEVAPRYARCRSGTSPINPLDLTEDELLLALPLAPMHGGRRVPGSMPPDSTQSEQANEADEQKSPFARSQCSPR